MKYSVHACLPKALVGVISSCISSDHRGL
jgi:hypothetical protein